MLPMQSIDYAIEEMRFARKALGMRGGFLRPNPYNDRMAGDPAYDPFWAEAQELDFSIGFHEGGASGMPTVGVDRFESAGALDRPVAVGVRFDHGHQLRGGAEVIPDREIIVSEGGQ